MSYITINGHSYWAPCGDCKDQYCSSCVLTKYQKDLDEERDKRTSAEFLIEKELEPRINAERMSYDAWATSDNIAEWCDAFDFKIKELVEMFDENFNFSEFDFDGEDIVSRVGKLIYEYTKMTEVQK